MASNTTSFVVDYLALKSMPSIEGVCSSNSSLLTIISVAVKIGSVLAAVTNTQISAAEKFNYYFTTYPSWDGRGALLNIVTQECGLTIATAFSIAGCCSRGNKEL